MKIALLCFGPFEERLVNGSTTIARALGQKLVERSDVDAVNVIEVPVVWTALLEVFRDDWLADYDMVIGMGEGFPHFVSVELMAVREAKWLDDEDNAAPEDMFPEGPDVRISNLWWNGVTQTENLGLPSGSPGIGQNGYAGLGLCNAAHYHLLYWVDGLETRRAGFIHMPPQNDWEKRNGRTAEDYGDVFSNAVIEVLEHNRWIALA